MPQYYKDLQAPYESGSHYYKQLDNGDTLHVMRQSDQSSCLINVLTGYHVEERKGYRVIEITEKEFNQVAGKVLADITLLL